MRPPRRQYKSTNRPAALALLAAAALGGGGCGRDGERERLRGEMHARCAERLENGDIAAAESLCSQALALDTASAKAHTQLAWVDLHLKNHRRARSGFYQALTLDAAHEPAKLGLAELALAEGKFERAKAAFADILKGKGGKPAEAAAIWRRLGDLVRDTRPAGAVEAYENAVRLTPDDIAVRMTAAWLHHELGHAPDVVRLLESVKPADFGATEHLRLGHFLLADAYQQLGKPELAYEHGAKAAALVFKAALETARAATPPVMHVPESVVRKPRWKPSTAAMLAVATAAAQAKPPDSPATAAALAE